MKKVVLFFVCVIVVAHLQSQSLEGGRWQGIIEYQDEHVPFEFMVETLDSGLVITIKNGEERIRIDNTVIDGDSITITLNPFDAWIKARIDRHQMEGFWRKGYRSKGIPFKASYGVPRFDGGTKKGLKKLSGKYQVEFSSPSRQPYPAVALISADNDFLTGTFLTEVSDFRYFKGVARKDSIYMSSFDGAHAFLFKGKVEGDKLSGALVMDNNYSEEVMGVRNEKASIPNPFKEVSPGHRPYYDILSAGDPDVQIDEGKYFDKVLVLQFFGTWCPNSMDQANFLKDWYKDRPTDVEMLAVAYEPNFSTAYGNKRINDYDNSMNLPYDVSLGGQLSKGQAALALPYEDKINAFPTLVLVDKEGFIRYEFSYFNGPAAGEYNKAFIKKFNECIAELVAE